MNDRPTESVAAEDLRRRRERLVVRLARVDEALRQWGACRAARRLPADQQPAVPPPLRRETLAELRAMLVEELRRSEADA